MSNAAVKLGQKFAPARELDVFPTHGLYGQRPWWYLDVYFAQPGWLFIEVGSWTCMSRGRLAVSCDKHKQQRRADRRGAR